MDLLALLDEIRILAQNGLEYTEDEFDRRRYERLLEIVSESYADTLELPAAEVRRRFSRELGHITPKIGAEAAVFDSDGGILLIRRTDDGTWCLPCGWIDPHEMPEEAVVRETLEETGLGVRPLSLVGVFGRPAGAGLGPHAIISVLYLCEIVGGAATPTEEASEIRYWGIDGVPAWHEYHEQLARAAAAARAER